MLILSRHRDETIIIGDKIEITIVDIRGDKVRVGVQAPSDVSVHRREVYDAIQRENRLARINTKLKPGHWLPNGEQLRTLPGGRQFAESGHNCFAVQNAIIAIYREVAQLPQATEVPGTIRPADTLTPANHAQFIIKVHQQLVDGFGSHTMTYGAIADLSLAEMLSWIRKRSRPVADLVGA